MKTQSCDDICPSQFHKNILPVDIERCDDFWKRQILRDTSWDSNLMNSQHRIWSDYSPTGEVHTFSHQVSTNSTLFSFQPLFD